MCSTNPYRGIPQENIAQNDLRGGLEWVIGVMIEKLLNRDQHRALNGNHLKYVFTEEVPDTDINEEKLDETVEGKLHSIPKRLDAFIEDLALLCNSDVVDRSDWNDMWNSVDDPEENNGLYADYNTFGTTDDTDDQYYGLGLRLGHLANLFVNATGLDVRSKNTYKVISGFILGINGEGMTNPKEVGTDELQRDLREDKKMSESVRFSMEQLPHNHKHVKQFEQVILQNKRSFPTAELGDIKNAIDHHDLEPVPSVMNAISIEASNLRENPIMPHKACGAGAESISVDYRSELDCVPDMIKLLNEEINQLSQGLYGRKNDRVTGNEVLRASYICNNSNSTNRTIVDIVKSARGGTRKKAAKRKINNSLNKVKGISSNPEHWEDNPIITREDTPTAFGKMVAKIVIPDDRIRDTDRYLPTRQDDSVYITPTKEEVDNACYAFALDCPLESPEESWNDIFNAACQEKL
jgi:hypothetical protein